MRRVVRTGTRVLGGTRRRGAILGRPDVQDVQDAQDAKADV